MKTNKLYANGEVYAVERVATLEDRFNELTIEPAGLKDGELRRCPFCNGEAEIKKCLDDMAIEPVTNELRSYINKYYVRCTRCGAQIYNNKADTPEVASLQWNLRMGR